MTALVGAGGWSYFAGGLPAYARAFSFVEVNATFYRRVSEARSRLWRRQVPSDFVFSLKVNREVTHRARLHATPAARDAFAHDMRVARTLRAPYVVLETPASLPLGGDQLAGLRDLAGMVPPGLRIGLEARAHSSGRLPPSAERTMEDLGVLDVVDLSRGPPRLASDVVYTRLFGKGDHTRYEFDDAELREIDRAGRDAIDVVFAFHGVRMYRDAARFLTFRRTGSFPPVTGSVGADSLAEVLREDARFPSTRDAVLKAHRWKVVDLDATTRAHAHVLLERLPDRTYGSLDDLLGEARSEGFPTRP